MTSIRRRTSLLVATTTAGLLALGGVVLFVVVRESLSRQFDDGLSARAAALQGLTRLDAGSVEMDFTDEVMPRYQPGEDAEFFVAWVRDGQHWRVLERAESLRAVDWPSGAGEPTPPGFSDQLLPNGEAGRSLMIEFIPLPEHEGSDEADKQAQPRDVRPPIALAGMPAAPVRLLVAQSRRSLDRALGDIALAIGAVGVALVLAIVGATAWAVRRGTKTLDDVSAGVAALGPDSLHRRLSVDNLPEELAPVVHRVNELLVRLDEAFARERRFSSAASHELRTPIAELRALLEVGLSQPRDVKRWEHTARDGLAVLLRAQRLAEALLRLSRAGAGNCANTYDTSVDLAEILRAEATRALQVGGLDSALLTIQAPPELPARVEPAVASSIIGNLIDNALRHGAVGPDQPVRCQAFVSMRGACVTINNTAPALTEADLPRLIEPFWRKDSTRTSNDGFGLGLAVSQALAESAGASLHCNLQPNHQFAVEVCFRQG